MLDLYVYLLVGVHMCECVFFCVFVYVYVYLYVCLYQYMEVNINVYEKVHEISVCIFSFRLLPLSAASRFGIATWVVS